MNYDPSYRPADHMHRMITTDDSMMSRADPTRAAYFANRPPATSNRFADRDRLDRERLARHADKARDNAARLREIGVLR